MNSAKGVYKQSTMMKTTNPLIAQVFVLQLLLSGAGGFIGANWHSENLDNPYLLFHTPGADEDDPSKGAMLPDDDFDTWQKIAGAWILICT